jgi:hypothetical protein
MLGQMLYSKLVGRIGELQFFPYVFHPRFAQ